MLQLLQERARGGVALPAPAAPAEVAQPECLAPAMKDLSLAELKEAFEKRLYELLLEPNVMANLRRLLCSRKDPKGTRELFDTRTDATERRNVVGDRPADMARLDGILRTDRSRAPATPGTGFRASEELLRSLRLDPSGSTLWHLTKTYLP